MPHKKIILFTDNFEYDLIRQKDKNITTFIEKLIVYLNEFIGLKNSDLVSYITRQDKNAMDKFYGIKKSRNLILPVIFSREKPTDVLSAHFINEYNRLNNDNRKKVVFTASFDFFFQI